MKSGYLIYLIVAILAFSLFPILSTAIDVTATMMNDNIEDATKYANDFPTNTWTRVGDGGGGHLASTHWGNRMESISIDTSLAHSITISYNWLVYSNKLYVGIFRCYAWDGTNWNIIHQFGDGVWGHTHRMGAMASKSVTLTDPSYFRQDFKIGYLHIQCGGGYGDSSEVAQIDNILITGLVTLPTFADEQPTNNSQYVLINSNMSVIPINTNNNSMNVSFYWGNHTLINTVYGVANNTMAEFSITDHLLMSHDTNYSWYVFEEGGGENYTSIIWNFHTCRAWDLNGDGETNYLDVSSLVSHYGETVSPPGYQPWDINNDGDTNYLDVSSLVSHYGESY